MDSLGSRRLGVLLLPLALVLAGCGGGSGASSSSASARGGAAAQVPKQGAGTGRAEPVRLPPAQAIIYTADMSMRAGDVAQAAGQAKQIVTAAGGYVGNENATEDPGSRPSATITFKIPSAAYQRVLDQLASSRIGMVRRSSIPRHSV